MNRDDDVLWLNATVPIELLTPTPLLVIASDQAETLDQSKAAYARANEPKELFLLAGGTHFDLYDRPEYVDPAIAKIDAFFKNHL